MLQFPNEWRGNPPLSVGLETQTIPSSAVQEFIKLIRTLSTQGEFQEYIEHFKKYYCLSNGKSYYKSSSPSWAETDLLSEMEMAAKNAPMFLEAFYNASENLRSQNEKLDVPDAKTLNAICRANNIGYLFEPPELKLLDKDSIIPVPEKDNSLEIRGRDILQKSLVRSEELLNNGYGKEAVQESLWLLETVSTAFRGLDTEVKTVEGKYFNKIVKDLRTAFPGTTMDRALEWIASIHGYLSSPTGGAVRHGIDLREGLDISINEALLFCNLTRSFLVYLLGEHDKLSKGT